MQGRSLDGVKATFGNGKIVCVVRASFCSCLHANDYRYAKENEKIELHPSGQLMNPRRPNTAFHQRTSSSGGQLVGPCRVILQTARNING